MSKIKWGIIGPGVIAHQFADDFRHVGNAELVAVASRNLTRAQSFARQYSIGKAYDDYQALYSDTEVEAVYMATPHNFHFRQSVDALTQGKAVLCEKPITINPKELDELLKTASSTGNYLIEGMWTYFLPALLQAQRWIEEDRLGKIFHVKADFGYPVPFDANGRMYNPDLAGGSLLDLGIYVIAIAWLFLKQDPSGIRVVSRKATTGVDNDISIQFEYANAAASLTTSLRCKLHNWAFIIGEKGYIAIPDFWRARECFFYEGETLTDHFVDDRKGHGFEFEIESVSEDLKKGKVQSDVVPHLYSVKFQEHMEAVRARF